MGPVGRKAVWGAALTLCVLIPAASASAGPGRKIDRLLQQAAEGSARQVILRTTADGKERIKKKLSNRGHRLVVHGIISAITAELDDREIADLRSDPGVLSVSADARVRAMASGNKGTGSGVTTATVPVADAIAAAGSTDATAVSAIKKVLGIQDWFTGSNVTVALIDSGLQNSIDFSGRIAGFYDFTDGKGAVATLPYDEYGHGTHVAGLIGSSGAWSDGTYAGVAPGVNFLGLKVLDKKGSGRTSSVISALEFAVQNKDRFGIRIVNLSLGHPIYEPAASDPLVQAVEAAVRAGLIVVASAGNYGTSEATGLEGYAGIASPGNAPSAITVGASDTADSDTRDDDRVASFSSRGPSWFDGFAKPDVVAPGSNLVSNRVLGSTLSMKYPSLVVWDGWRSYLRLTGSSMATAVVSGVVALMIEASERGSYERWQKAQIDLRRNLRTEYGGAPPLTPNAIKAMLQYSATPLRDGNGSTYDALTQGSGEVNGPGALLLAYSTDTTRDAGAFWLTTAWPTTTRFGGVDQPWAQTVVWGTRILRGSSIVEVNQAAWAANIVWGTGELDNLVWGTVSDDGDNIVWGTFFSDDNIVWGTLFSGNAEFAENIVWGTRLAWDDNIVWGTGLVGTFNGDNILWGTVLDDADNIVWGTLSEDNIVWGTNTNMFTVLKVY